MGRIKRGGYVFETWEGDHEPAHVHIYEDGRLVAKVKLEDLEVLKGEINSKILCILILLRKDGRL